MSSKAIIIKDKENVNWLHSMHKDPVAEMSTLEGDVVTIQEMAKKIAVRSGNPYRADGGRFGSGESIAGLNEEQIDKYAAMAGDAYSDEMHRSILMERVTQDLGYNDLPTRASSLPPGTEELYRGWREQSHIDSYLNDTNPRLSIGIFGSGVYLSNNRNIAGTYAKNNLLTKFGIKSNAKIGDATKLREELFNAAPKLMARQQRELDANRKIKDKIRRVEEGVKLQMKHTNEKKLFMDVGAVAAIRGYQVLRGTYDGNDDAAEYIILDRGALIYVEGN